MTKNICVLGNSHAACFKAAWDKLKNNHPGVSLTFFAERASGLAELEAKDGVLVPASDHVRIAIEHTSGGLSAVDPKAYHAVLIVGFLSGYPRVDGHFSQAAARQALLDGFTPDNVAFDLIRKIRLISQIPIFIAHQPLLKQVGKPTKDINAESYRRIIKFLNDALIGDMGATLLAQPEETISNDFYTRTEYSIGSFRLDIGDRWSNLGHPENDRTHMNLQYGKAYLSAHLPTIVA